MYGPNKPINQSIMDNRPYHNEKLTYTDEGNLMDSRGNAIMMSWEDGIMEHQASHLCANGGDILNVGFGLGLIDNYIQSYSPITHWIIESHPEVQRKIIEDGWLKKPNVKVIFKPWQEVIHYLPKFDGIYFDTWGESQNEFDTNIYKLLKPCGIYSFFNNPMCSGDNNIMVDPYNILSKFCDITTDELKLNNISSLKSQGHEYWDPNNDIYYSPICRLKENFR